MKRSILWPVILAALGVWTVVFLLGPVLIVLKISLAEAQLARPPYTPLLIGEDGGFRFAATLSNYAALASDGLYARAFAKSLWIAALSTALALAVGMPFAYAIAKAPAAWRAALIALALLPFWTSFLIRVYAWIAILKDEGLLNGLLLKLGLIASPLSILDTDGAVVIGIVYAYLPFMVLPIYAAFERIPADMAEAAADLGAGPIRTFWTVTLPLAAPGIVAGSLLVFIPAVGEAIVPDLLGGADSVMIGKTLWAEFFQNRDWPLASAIAIVLLIGLVGPIVALERREARMAAEGRS